MNRNQFLKRLGIGAAAVIVAPEIPAEVKPEPHVIGLNEFISLREKMAETVANIPVTNQEMLQWTKETFNSSYGPGKRKLYVYSCESYNKFVEMGFPEDRMVLMGHF